MRGMLVLSVVLVAALTLAGCSGGSDSSSSTSGSGTKSSTSGNGTKAPTTKANVTKDLPPIIVLKVTDSAGTATNVTYVNEEPRTKGNLTFSAVGSKDQDSDGLSAIAITVQDTNRTYPAGVLYSSGSFKSVTYSFDRAGPVNVTVSGIDVRGEVTTLRAKVFVDLKTTPTGTPFKSFDPALYSDGDCTSPLPDTLKLAAGNFYDERKFTSDATTTFVEASVSSGNAKIQLCAPDHKTAISGFDGASVVSKKGTVFADTVGDAQYFVVVDSQAGTDAGQNSVAVDVVVHYEPQP
jgi:hypothetical protein